MPEFVLPSRISFEGLKSRQLEECLYWLAASMGAKNLEWRLGGRGDGASDGGRDLEATFLSTSPDGDSNRSHWWIEVKGRSRTVEPSAVKEAVINTKSRSDVDVLVIATNSDFSNPTRDWVKDWQRTTARPVVKLWDRHTLEKLLSDHPEVVVRLFPGALTLEGRIAAATSAFWDYCQYADKRVLVEAWASRKEMKWDHQSLLMIIASEFANGDIEDRAWGPCLPLDKAAEILGTCLLNAVYFAVRASRAGIEQEPFLRVAAYMVQVLLWQIPPSDVAELLGALWSTSESDGTTSLEMQDMVTRPVLTTLWSDLNAICTSDCHRVSAGPRMDLERVAAYWNRFRIREPALASKEEEQLVIELFEIPCQIGLQLDRDVTCPINGLDLQEDSVEQILQVLHKILHARMPDDLKPNAGAGRT